jgi:hypothetical protein
VIDLPSSPAPASAEPALVDFGGDLVPALGGPAQRIERMGSRFRLAVQMPPMRGSAARQWLSRLIRAKQEGGRMPFPLQGFEPGAAGAVKVNGAGQSGRSLVVDGARPNYIFREGQFLSILTGGQHFLHFVTAETLANASGQATLPIEPMLRIAPADNADVHVEQPMIEGFIEGSELPWSMALADFVGLAFTLTERR